MIAIPENLIKYLYHGREEVYLEYKGDVAWTDRAKMLEIVQTIFALSNERDGGIIVIGVEDNGTRCGLSVDNFSSYSHDTINRHLKNKGNQPIQCKIEKFEHLDIEDKKTKRIVIIQVSEIKEFPLVYIGNQELVRKDIEAYNKNIALRAGALYIRNKLDIGNKEISTTYEWKELIERTFKKFEKETLRRYAVIKDNTTNPFDKELKI